MSEGRALYGWQSDLPTFVNASTQVIEAALIEFVRQVSGEQQSSWQRSIAWLQREYDYCIREDTEARSYSTVLEYQLPRDFRRPDVIVLEGTTIVVLEVKGKAGATRAARDQVSAYARDLSAYHVACADRQVIPVVVPSDGPDVAKQIDGVAIVGPAGLHSFLLGVAQAKTGKFASPEEFLRNDAYAPLPTIVQAARVLYRKELLPRIKPARAATEPALQAITNIAHEAARTKTRRLVLLSGVPGSGKTLVGLQLVHSGWLDDLAIQRSGRKMSPAVYLSGNGPLVAVLQDALRGGEAPGSVFVQDIKKYVAYYGDSHNRTPPEHLIVFDEAQRAHDAERVAHVHKQPLASSEPDLLLEFCSRIPEWCVLVALIGEGQAIHVGEEGGVGLWGAAIAKRPREEEWRLHAPESLSNHLTIAAEIVTFDDTLSLDKEIRFHLTPKVHEYVESLLDDYPSVAGGNQADELYRNGHRFLVTRSLSTAKQYLSERYGGAPEARFGILASSKDKILVDFDVDNSFQTTKRLKVGPWYNRPPGDPLSCCQLKTVATEFSSQGLELDAALLAWGSDLVRVDSAWSIGMSRGSRGQVRDPMQMRKNVYRVLLTRGRDGTLVFLPDHPALHETWHFLLACGFRNLDVD